MNKLSITERAYIAGIIDGEGTIGLTKHKERRTLRGWNYEPYIMVSNTSKSIMEYLKEVTGIGYYWSKTYKNMNRGWKVPFAWQTGARREIISLLEQILPYLVIKKRHAVLLLEYVKMREDQEKERIAFMKGMQIKYSKHHDEIFEKLRELNRRGRKRKC